MGTRKSLGPSRRWPTEPRTLPGSTLAGGHCSDLSFYDGHRLIELRFESSFGLERVFGLLGPAETNWLDGTSSPVHATNEAESLALTEETLHDYIRFFLYFVRADSGAFALIESESELVLAEGGGRSSADDNGSPASRYARMRQRGSRTPEAT